MRLLHLLKNSVGVCVIPSIARGCPRDPPGWSKVHMRMFESRVVAWALAAAAVGIPSVDSPAQLRIASWNLSNYNGGRVADIQTVVYGVVPAGLAYSGQSFSPDIICLQEFISASALNAFVSALNTAPGTPGDWAAAPFPIPAPPQTSLPDTQSVMVYRTSKVQFIREVTIALGSSDTNNQPRNTYRFDVRPIGYLAPSATLAIYNVHLKAGSTSTDIARRLVETTRIRDNVEGVNTNGPNTGMPAGYNAICLGDTNTQRADQSAYVELIGSQANNTGRFFDPINSGVNGSTSSTNGVWNSNFNYRFIHTQDPTGSGGMDDRLDHILLSASLINGTGLTYIGNPSLQFSQSTWNDPNHSHRTWGNDGTSCCNGMLNSNGNTMVGDVIAQAIMNTATAAGGHLPIYCDFKVPPKLGVNPNVSSISFGSVAQNSVAQQTVTISNAGNTALWTTAGISNLHYSLAATPPFSVPGGPFSDPLTPGGNNHLITLNTATPGIHTGMLTITCDDPDVPTRIINLSATVVNLPPVANAGPDQTLTDNDLNGFEPVTLNGSMSFDPEGFPLTNYHWTLGAAVLASGPAATANINLPVGVHTIMLQVTDNTSQTATDTVVITVNPGNQPPNADAGPDQNLTDTDRDGSELVMLDGSGSSDPDGTIVNFHWREGAATLANGPSPTANILFSLGTHTVTLTVTDNLGAIDSDTMQVMVLPNPCIADTDDGSGTGTPDGGVTIDDLIYYLAIFDLGALAADVDDGTGTGTPDGGITIDDLLYYLLRFDSGC